MAMVEEVVIRMGMDARPVSAALRGVRKDFAEFKAGLGKMDFGSMLTSGAGKLGIGLTGAALAIAAKESIEFAKEIKHLSEELGVSASTLQAWQNKVSKTGGDADIAAAGLEKLTIKIGEARSGTQSAIDSFSNLGVSLSDAEGHAKPTEEILYNIADKISAIEDPTMRAQAAFELFGKSGIKLVNALKDGSASLKEFKGATSKVLSDSEIDQLERVAKATKGFGQYFRTFVGRGVAILSDAWTPGQSNDVRRLLKDQKAPETPATFEQRAEKAKAVAAALEKLEKARRDIVMGEMSEQQKLVLMRREEATLRERLRTSEDGTVTQLELKTKLAEKGKEIDEQTKKIAEQQAKFAKDKLDAQEKLNKQKEHEREVARDISEAQGKRGSAQDDLMGAHFDRSRFTLQDLAQTDIDRWTTPEMAKQIMQARQIGVASQRARWLASRGYVKESQELWDRIDDVRGGMDMLTGNERNPFKQLEKTFVDSEAHLRELIRKASAEGIKVDPAMGA